MSKIIDIKELGVPNVCFSLISDDDPRADVFKQQRIENGFDDSETWCLATTTSDFLVPRLERFLECGDGIGDIRSDVEKLLKTMKLISRDGGLWIFDDTEKVEVEEGLRLLPDLFMKLWW